MPGPGTLVWRVWMRRGTISILHHELVVLFFFTQILYFEGRFQAKRSTKKNRDQNLFYEESDFDQEYHWLMRKFPYNAVKKMILPLREHREAPA